MNRIAEEVEGDPLYRSIITAQRFTPEPTGADAIAVATRDVAETLDLRAIVAWTSSGSTGLRIARERPQSPVLAITPNVATARRLALAWGVHAVVAEDARDVDDMAERACRQAFAKASRAWASASSSWRACLSARRAPPTWCASRSCGPSIRGEDFCLTNAVIPGGAKRREGDPGDPASGLVLHTLKSAPT